MAAWKQTSRAGSYAERRYRRGMARWQARTRLLLTVCFGPFVAIGLAGAVLEPHLLSWLAGMVCGGSVATWIALRESPPPHVEHWRMGAEGERKTAQTLQKLDAVAWRMAHDVQTSRGNYDHILAADAGIFLLDSKYPQGEAYLRNGKLWLRRRDDPDADAPYPWPRSSALAGAARLCEELGRRTGRRTWVRAVVVLWCRFEEGVHEDERYVVIHGSKLIDWLQRQPPTLDPRRLEALRGAIGSMVQD